MLELTEKLCSIPGVSGDESAVRAFLVERLEGVCELSVDSLGNLTAFKKGRKTPKKKLLFSAHTDEVGFIITHITDDGYLKFDTVGGIDSRTLPGKYLRVGAAGIPGVIGVKPLHLRSGEEKLSVPAVDSLTIDIGASDKKAAEEVVSLGDRAVFQAEFVRFGDGLISARALDDRAGCAMLVRLLESESEYDFYCAFTVLEEVGGQGAAAVGGRLGADIVVAVETTTASDIADVAPAKRVCELKKGPVVSFMDKGAVYDRPLYDFIMRTAEKHLIPKQAKQGIYGGNESRSYQTSGVGSRIAAVSLPARYLHSPRCVIAECDLENTFALLRAIADAAGEL